jgi:hypothetical protein
MTPKEKAEELVNTYRIVLMNEDTDCGQETLCTLIAKKNALIAVDEILKCHIWKYWLEVKKEIDKF